MNERFSKVFALTENLYTEGSPVIIEAGVLHKDNNTNTMFVQLKFRSISNKKIKAIKIIIFPKDIVGNALGDKVEYQYLDLDIIRNMRFGQKTPIYMPDNKTRSFSMSLTEVIFDDNSIWNGTDKPLLTIKSQQELNSYLADYELVKEYKLELGNSCRYYPINDRDLWFCSCGEVNHEQEQQCYKCGLSAQRLFDINFLELKNKSRKRVEEEKKEAQIKAEQQAEQSKKHTKIITIVSIAILIVVLIVVVINSVIIPIHNKNIAYNNAVALLNEGKYKEALDALEALDGYNNAEDLKNNTLETMYNKFTGMVDNGEYLEANAYYQEISECYTKNPDYKQLTAYVAYNTLKLFCTAPTEVSVTYDDISSYKDFLAYISDFGDHEQISDTINTLYKLAGSGFYLKDNTDIKQKKEVYLGGQSIDLYSYESVYTTAYGSHEYRSPYKSYKDISYLTQNGKLTKITFGPYEAVISYNDNSLEISGGAGVSSQFVGNYKKE